MAVPVSHYEPDRAASSALLHARTNLEALPRYLIPVHGMAALPVRLVPRQSHAGLHEEELPVDPQHGFHLHLHADGVDVARHPMPGRVALLHGTSIQRRQ